MTPLSAQTKAHVVTLFAGGDVGEAERLLAEECGENLPLVGSTKPTLLERIRFAAIKMSEGDLTKLQTAIRVAQQDWRDLLVAAGFAHRVDAHERWHPRRGDDRPR